MCKHWRTILNLFDNYRKMAKKSIKMEAMNKTFQKNRNTKIEDLHICLYVILKVNVCILLAIIWEAMNAKIG